MLCRNDISQDNGHIYIVTYTSLVTSPMLAHALAWEKPLIVVKSLKMSSSNSSLTVSSQSPDTMDQ